MVINAGNTEESNHVPSTEEIIMDAMVWCGVVSAVVMWFWTGRLDLACK